MENEYKIFKALNHPLRIKILRLIAKKGYASYKELAKLEPKSGVLYHHLKLLGDLIYQDENKLYRLTEKGWIIIDFLDKEFFEYEDKGFNKILTPRLLFERIEGKKYLFLAFLSFILAFFFGNSKFIILSLLISPSFEAIPHILTHSASLALIYFLPPILKDMLFGKTYFRKYRLIDHVSRSSLITLMISLLIYILGFIENYIALIICYFLIQILFILYMTAEISVSFRIPLKKAFIITLILHYIGLAAYAIILVV